MGLALVLLADSEDIMHDRRRNIGPGLWQFFGTATYLGGFVHWPKIKVATWLLKVPWLYSKTALVEEAIELNLSEYLKYICMNVHLLMYCISTHEGFGIYFLPFIVDPGHLKKSDLALRTLHSNLSPAFKSIKAPGLNLMEVFSRKYGMYARRLVSGRPVGLSHDQVLDSYFSLLCRLFVY